MSELLRTLRAIVRDELKRLRTTELGVVTASFPRDSDSSDGNHQVNVKLRSSGLELQRVPVAVARVGLSAVPRPDDLVLVAFSGGDLQAPVVVGCLYDEQSHPPVAKTGEVVYAPVGDASGLHRVRVTLENGCAFTWEDDSITLEAGGTKVVVENDGNVTIQAKGNIALKAEGNITLEAQGDVKVEASGAAAMKGANTTVESQASTTVKGPQVTLAGMTQFSPS